MRRFFRPTSSLKLHRLERSICQMSCFVKEGTIIEANIDSFIAVRKGK